MFPIFFLKFLYFQSKCYGCTGGSCHRSESTLQSVVNKGKPQIWKTSEIITMVLTATEIHNCVFQINHQNCHKKQKIENIYLKLSFLLTFSPSFFFLIFTINREYLFKTFIQFKFNSKVYKQIIIFLLFSFLPKYLSTSIINLTSTY
jgi:hypothetical protein